MVAVTTAPGIIAQTCKDVLLKVASTREERESAFRLTYHSYLEAGLCEPNPAEVRFTPHQMLPTTEVFIGQLRNETICTMSLVLDGELGLPMESSYPSQVQERRSAGLRVAEVTCLADRRSSQARFFGLFCDLSRLMVQFARHQGIDQLLIAVHPRHARLYSRGLAFQEIGGVVAYGDVLGNPAVPLCLDLSSIRTDHPNHWKKFFADQLPSESLESQPIHEEDRTYFCNQLQQSSIPQLAASKKPAQQVPAVDCTESFSLAEHVA